MLACLIDLNQLFAEINDMPKSYSVISFLRWNDGRVIAPQAYRKQAEQAIADGAEVYTYPLANLGTAYIQKVEDGEILQNVHFQLGLFNMEMVLLWLEVILVVRLCYRWLFHPFTKFVTGLENVGTEEIFDRLDENDILELETINRQFKTLSHRLKDMRIALYEQEITKKQTELELLQEQVRPHFFLNCLSLVHSLADRDSNWEITELLEDLSGYIRYLFGPTANLRKISEEINHVKLYIQLQHKRYGDAFSCTIDVDEDLRDYFIPKLMLQTLVENSIQHNAIYERPCGGFPVPDKRSHGQRDLALLLCLRYGKRIQRCGHGRHPARPGNLPGRSAAYWAVQPERAPEADLRQRRDFPAFQHG